MKQTYELYYKTKGVNSLSQLRSRVFETHDFQFPKNSIYHYSGDVDDYFPDETMPYLQEYTQSILTYNWLNLATQTGNPIKQSSGLMIKINQFYQKHRRFRRLDGLAKSSNNPEILEIINYGLLEVGYRYTNQSNPLLPYLIWYNKEQSIQEGVQTAIQTTDRQNFRIIEIPEIIPSVVVLKMYGDKSNFQPTKSLLNIMDDASKLIILDLWRWLGSQRTESIHGEYKEHELDKINYVFIYKNRWGVINLGVLNNWRASRESKDNSKGSMEILQKQLLRFILNIQGRLPNIENQESVGENNEEGSNEFELDQDLSTLEFTEKLVSSKLSNSNSVHKSKAEIDIEINTDQNTQQQLMAEAESYAEYGNASATEYRRIVNDINSLNQFDNPFNAKIPIKDFIQISSEEMHLDPDKVQFADSERVLDKSMLRSTLVDYDERYIQNTLPKHILASVLATQKAGFIIRSYTIDKEQTAVDGFQTHILNIQPIGGSPSTISFRLPVINEEGEFISSGTKYRQRKQRCELPIRKISATEVALSSYYGKVMVKRNETKRTNPDHWLYNYISVQAQRLPKARVQEVTPANVFDNYLECPKIYSGLGHYFKSIQIGKDPIITLYFSRKEVQSWLPPETIQNLEKDHQAFLCGKDTEGHFVMVNDQNEFMIIKPEGSLQLGTIYDILEIPITNVPCAFSSVTIYNKSVPVVLLLGYFLGLTNLLTYLGMEYTKRETKRGFTPERGYDMIVFRNTTIVYKSHNPTTNLILDGFKQMKSIIKRHNIDPFDHQNVYLTVMSEFGIGARYIKEAVLVDKLFIDPITFETLKGMNEPTTFRGLLLRATELLVKDYHPDVQDTDHMRFRGYERVPGAVYRQLILSIREYNNKNFRGRSKIDMNPYAVWNAIVRDPSVTLVEDINPVNNLREQEAVTYVGEGGRKKDTITKITKAYHLNDIGTISEATVDNRDVGVNTFFSANPRLSSVSGLSMSYDFNKDGASSLVSTSALLSPGIQGDDAKRVNFINIQHNHTIACKGYHPPILRTGYEEIIPHRVGKLFAYTARGPGEVTHKNARGMIIRYESGKEVGIHLGRVYGKAGGSIYPHLIKTDLEVGAFFEQGDAIAYNTGFFERDFYNPKRLIFKNSMTVTVALFDNIETNEDSSIISPRISQKMRSEYTRVRKIIVDFDNGISQIRPAGSAVKPNDILFVLESRDLSDNEIFGEVGKNILINLSNKSPKARVNGRIDQYVVYYNGSLEDMSDSLRQFIRKLDQERILQAKSSMETPYTGRVSAEYQIDGRPLQPNTAVIETYITAYDDLAPADKIVLGNQMKSVVGHFIEGEMKTESGEIIDIGFGATSIEARIVISTIEIGTTVALLKLFSRRMANIYYGANQ